MEKKFFINFQYKNIKYNSNEVKNNEIEAAKIQAQSTIKAAKIQAKSTIDAAYIGLFSVIIASVISSFILYYLSNRENAYRKSADRSLRISYSAKMEIVLKDLKDQTIKLENGGNSIGQQSTHLSIPNNLSDDLWKEQSILGEFFVKKCKIIRNYISEFNRISAILERRSSGPFPSNITDSTRNAIRNQLIIEINSTINWIHSQK